MWWRIALFLIIVGGVLVAFAVEERNVSAGATEQPEVLTLKALIARGPDGNPNVVITDYVLGDNYVYEESKNTKVWSKVYVPVAPRDEVAVKEDGEADITNVRAIVVSKHVSDEAGIASRLEKDRLPGLVTNKITKLGTEEKRLLHQSYPNADLEHCLIIEEGREPSGAGKVLLLGGGGAALVLAGIAAFILGIVRRR
jgi:hypothetical protein